MISHPEQQYLDAMRRVWTEGSERIDRTGVGTRSLFGVTMRFDLSDG
ncbi:MAG TPA: thymidylate synthase, partial [Sphingomonas sp.]|nr:thymidylate synthase [Sphingomonas sp.]